MSEYRIGDVVIFGRKQGEKTLGTVTKVNKKTVKVRQEEARGTQKSHKIGMVWGVPIQPGFLRHATEAEAARLQDRDTAKAAPRPSQVPPRKPVPRGPSQSEFEAMHSKFPEHPGYKTEAEKTREKVLLDQRSKRSNRAAENRAEAKRTGKKPSQIEDENCTRRRAENNRRNPRVISDGSKLPGRAMPGILADAQKLVGLRIAQIGYISEDGENWPVVILEDGTELRASRDDECNGPGTLLFGENALCEIFA